MLCSDVLYTSPLLILTLRSSYHATHTHTHTHTYIHCIISLHYITLHCSVKKQSENAAKVAAFLETHPAVDVVRYPGLASFPQKALADKMHKNGLHGGMLWFEVKGGSGAGRKLMDSINR